MKRVNIYYDKKFIRVPGGFIPIVQYGDNLTTQLINGVKVPAKEWTIFGLDKTFIHTEEEILNFATEYLKTTNILKEDMVTSFAEGEFSEWYIEGRKESATVEDYIHLGESIIVYEMDNTIMEINKRKIKDTNDLLTTIKSWEIRKNFIAKKMNFDIGF